MIPEGENIFRSKHSEKGHIFPAPPHLYPCPRGEEMPEDHKGACFLTLKIPGNNDQNYLSRIRCVKHYTVILSKLHNNSII